MKKGIQKHEIAGSVRLRPIPEIAWAGLAVFAGGAVAGGRLAGGRIQEISSIKDLPRGVWMTNLAWHETRSFKREPRVLLQPGDWLQIAWNDLLSEWSIKPGKQELMANRLARVVARVAKLVLKTSENMGHPGKKGLTGLNRILENPSLAQGFRRELEARLSESFPREIQLCAPTKDMHQVGVRSPARRRNPELGTVIAKIPPLAHLRKLASRLVPAPGTWSSCSLPGQNPIADENILAELRGLGRPIIFETVFRPGGNTVPSWLEAWVSGSDPVFGRRHFSLEEIDCMSLHGECLLHAAYAGPGWRPEGDSVIGDALASLVKACGCGGAAGAFWSAGAAAELILCAAMSLSPNSLECPSLETLWISLADRIAMIPAIEAAENAGAELVSARAGRLKLRVPDDSAAFREIAGSLWRAGAVVPGVQQEYVDGHFGGSSEGEMYARCMLGSSRKAAWLLDSVMDSPPDVRREMFEKAKPVAMRLLGN
ncbi:MAG: hypothetical protein OXN84_14695 [Albidovulum sp.]|nr:hypothetical protein [Albidovulum sp.]MDE0532448.1 hypothetical protein [Albidovulum sp.]